MLASIFVVVPGSQDEGNDAHGREVLRDFD
jgi:hypothetical protein